MKSSTLLASTAIAALMCTGALAQDQQKRGNESAPSMQQEQSPQRQQKAEPQAPKGQAQGQAQGQQDRQPGAKQAEPNKQAEPKKDATPRAERSGQQPGQKQATPDSKDAPNTGKKAETPRSDTGKSAETPRDDKSKAADSKSGASDSKSADTKTGDSKSGDKVQLSEKQRTDVHRDILKESNVNRVNVNVNVRIGERVPRDVRLAALPASIVSIVPAYRSYRYFVIEERVVIVDPASYEIVEVIMPGGQVADRGPSGTQRLTLTAEEREIVLAEIDISRGGSTLGIGALSEGASVPRSAELMNMPSVVVERVSKLQGYKYFVAEQRVAIVDPSGDKIQLILDAKR